MCNSLFLIFFFIIFLNLFLSKIDLFQFLVVDVFVIKFHLLFEFLSYMLRVFILIKIVLILLILLRICIHIYEWYIFFIQQSWYNNLPLLCFKQYSLFSWHSGHFRCRRGTHGWDATAAWCRPFLHDWNIHTKINILVENVSKVTPSRIASLGK